MKPTAQQKWNAEDYAKNFSAQLQGEQEFLSKLAWQAYESVLDIGCGDGKISAQLCPPYLAFRIYAVEMDNLIISTS